MEGPRAGQRLGSPRATANDRLKARWQAVLAWSTAAAVGLHAALLLGWPSWDLPRPPPRATVAPELVQWLALQETASGGGGQPAPVAAGVDEDSLPTGSDRDAGVDGWAGDLVGLSDALLERLRRRPSPRPALTPPPPSPRDEDEGEAAADGDDPESVLGDPSTAVLASLPEAGPVDMDRLSALQPQLALTSVSDWVLVRNPREVVEYIHETYRRGDLSPDASGLVSVTLWIDRTGAVEWSEIKESSGRRDIDQLALKLFTEVASFRPALEEGVPVARSVIFILAFPWM